MAPRGRLTFADLRSSRWLSLPHNLIEIRRGWPGLSAYERFEAFVALILTLLIAAVLAVAVWRLTYDVVDTLVLRSLNPLEHGVFQAVFGQILTVLIALEFNHTLQYVVTPRPGRRAAAREAAA
jgi:hypothetical protein